MVLDDSGTVVLDDPSTVALDGNEVYRDIMEHIKAMAVMFLARREAVVLCLLPFTRMISNGLSHLQSLFYKYLSKDTLICIFLHLF
jgi:hypothetical protein